MKTVKKKASISGLRSLKKLIKPDTIEENAERISENL